MAEVKVGVDPKHKLIGLNLQMINRHGLVTGATGTGKTVTQQTIAEQLSQDGICVFAADIKGDLSGIAYPMNDNPKIKERLQELKIKDYHPHGNPVILWDVYGKVGHPLRTTISEMGPLLLGRLLNASEVQQGVLNAAFSFADDQGLLLLDIKDLRSLLEEMISDSSEIKKKYGNVTSNTVGALQRGLLTLEEAGGDQFFGEPAFDIRCLFQKDKEGRGRIHILDATQLINDSRLYTTFLLWLLSELFEILPEVGDLDQPKLVFFFDEAHALFESAPKVLLEKIEQLVRLIRSKGIGVYFITQSPLDIPQSVIGQLGNRIQHALRAYTPKDQAVIKTVAETFRQNPPLDIETTIREMAVGEALISFLDVKGVPMKTDKIKVIPPESRIGPISTEERQQLIEQSPFFSIYENMIDRESAYEMIEKRTREKIAEETANPTEKSKGPRQKETIFETMAKSTARSIGSHIGRQIMRGILGSIFRKQS